MTKYFVELIGTFFLVLTIALTGNPLAIGAILIAMIYMGGYISGGHFNPAVTIAVFMRRKIDLATAGRYMIAQIAGGFIAALVVDVLTGSLFIPATGSGVTFTTALLAEIIFTFALASVVLHVATSDKVKGNQYYGLAIGLTVMAAAFAIGPISGAALNPAVAIGPMIADIVNISTHGTNLALYIIGPMVGGILAGVAYNVMQENK